MCVTTCICIYIYTCNMYVFHSMASSAFSAVTKQTKRGPHGRRADMASACEASARLGSGLKMSQAPGTSPGITSLRKWQLVASRHSWQNSRQITHLYAVRLTTQSLHVTTLGISRSRTQSRHLPLKLFDLSLDLSTRKTHRPMTSSPVRRSRWHVENLTPAAESAWACPCKKRCTELLNVSEPITKSKNVKAARKLVITLQ